MIRTVVDCQKEVVSPPVWHFGPSSPPVWHFHVDICIPVGISGTYCPELSSKDGNGRTNSVRTGRFHSSTFCVDPSSAVCAPQKKCISTRPHRERRESYSSRAYSLLPPFIPAAATNAAVAIDLPISICENSALVNDERPRHV